MNGTAEAFTWNLAEGLPLIIQDGRTRYLTGPDGLPIEQIDGNGKVAYYLQDQLGSTRGLIDSTGAIVGTSTFSDYGIQTGHDGSTSTPFEYAGQYTDAESGYQYLRARYYDPATAQFLTMDPLVDQTGQPYGYADGNPLAEADPLGLGCGLSWSGAFDCAGAALRGAAHVAGSALNAAKETGRQALRWTFKTAADWIGTTHDDLTSGDPGKIFHGVLSVVMAVTAVLPGPGLVERGGLEAAELLLDVAGGLVEEGAACSTTTYVVGRLADTEVDRGWAGYAVFEGAWSMRANAAWLEMIIRTRARVYLATPVTEEALAGAAKYGGVSVYARELYILYKAGYHRVGNFLVPPP